MNLYKISQTVNDGWETYSDAVVVAGGVEDARNMHPAFPEFISAYISLSTWCVPAYVQVEYLGVAAEHLDVPSVICASYRGG